MLQIPHIIERAYSTIISGTGWSDINGDRRHKEVRIHFPNGEIRDLWNYDIVQESFNFTESVCSADVLKFGLCEAAEVTFEVVGVEQNFAGCKIEVFYEIDVSDLEEEHHCAGRYVSDPPSISIDIDENNCNRTIGDEVERGVYSIPIGTFTVIECERSKSDMTHRSVRAITKVFETNDDMTPFEQWRISQLHRTKTFSMPIPNYIDCQVGKPSDSSYESKLIDYISVLPSRFHPGNSSHKDSCFIYGGSERIFAHNGKLKKDSHGNHVPVNPSSAVENSPVYGSIQWSREFARSDDYNYYSYSDKVLQYALYHIRKTTHPLVQEKYDTYEHFKEYFISLLKTAYGDPTRQDVYTPEEIDYVFNCEYFDESELKSFYNECLFRFGVWYSSTRGASFNALENEWVMPYDAALRKKAETSSAQECGRFLITHHITVSLKKLNYWYAPSRTISIETPIDLWGPDASLAPGTGVYPPVINLKFDHTLDTKAKTYRYSFYNAFTMRDIIEGWLEINAMFGHQKRDGKYEYMNLGDTVGMYSAFYKTDIEKLYFDEFDVDDIGYVIYKYKKNKNDKEVEVIYDLETGGTSIYDMTDNTIFSILDEDEKITDKQLRTKIETYLNTYFKPNLEPIVDYYPAEITLHSKPYLEAGDRYTIILDPGMSGKNFRTYNLSMTMSGIQNSKTDIVSTSGTLIDGTALGVKEEDDDE